MSKILLKRIPSPTYPSKTLEKNKENKQTKKLHKNSQSWVNMSSNAHRKIIFYKWAPCRWITIYVARGQYKFDIVLLISTFFILWQQSSQASRKQYYLMADDQHKHSRHPQSLCRVIKPHSSWSFATVTSKYKHTNGVFSYSSYFGRPSAELQ